MILKEHFLCWFAFQEDEFELTDFEDYDDNGDIFADPASASAACVYPAACRVIYSYQVKNNNNKKTRQGSCSSAIELI